jgi:hypothetical protein
MINWKFQTQVSRRLIEIVSHFKVVEAYLEVQIVGTTTVPDRILADRRTLTLRTLHAPGSEQWKLLCTRQYFVQVLF